MLGGLAYITPCVVLFSAPDDCRYDIFQASARSILTKLQLMQRFGGDKVNN